MDLSECTVGTDQYMDLCPRSWLLNVCSPAAGQAKGSAAAPGSPAQQWPLHGRGVQRVLGSPRGAPARAGSAARHRSPSQ